MTSAATPTRIGRPPKVDADGVATRERLLVAAVASCVSQGFEGATVADIAERAGVSGPAIYRHFGGKAELMVAAGRWALDRLTEPAGRPLGPTAVTRLYLSAAFADTRVLLSELHLAGQRRPEVAALLADWHRQRAAEFVDRWPGPHAPAQAKVFFALLLGLCQIDSLASLSPDEGDVADQAIRMIHALFPEEEPS
jgi:AcrR family transcriptional regulator